MNYLSYNKCDVLNGTGVRCVLWCSGCTHKCQGCFSEESWKFCNGLPFDQEIQDKIINDLKPDYISGLTLSGGDSMHPRNAVDLIPFVKRIKEELPSKNIWCYTGYVLEDLLDNEIQKELLSLIDVLVDGPFVQELADSSLKFRGSSNQRIIMVKKTLRKGEIVLWHNGDYT